LLTLTAALPAGVSADDPSAVPSASPDPSPDPSVEASPVQVAPSEGPPPIPSADPSAVPSADPSPAPSPVASDPAASDPAATDVTGGLDPDGRYIVVVEGEGDVSEVLGRQRDEGVHAVRTFDEVVDGFVARLDEEQVESLEADPAVEAVVPDELISIQQSTPTGVSRIFGPANGIASIDGVNERVDADIAIVDTGISGHSDLYVAGGVNCSTPDPNAWRDVHGHGTHVAGIAAARDDAWGVVGVAPGARLWAVKILNDSGFGYLSWYVCGLDWIAAQRDPTDPSQPLMEVANMSVAKSGRDDRACGSTSNDVLHAAICRLVGSGVTVVAAAGNEKSSAAAYVPAAYNEVITVSALADTDGKSGGRGGNACSSFGSYDQDDTLADFSNAGSDVDLIAPGKCIKSTLPGNTYGLMSGTSMATPHVTGAVALYKESRPESTPNEVREALQHLGNLGWKTWTDRDSYHEKLLDVSRLARLGSFSVAVTDPPIVGGQAGTVSIPVRINRSSTFLERVYLKAKAPAGWTASFSPVSVFGFGGTVATLRLTRPAGTPFGVYPVSVTGFYHSMVRTTSFQLSVENVPPVATAPSVTLKTGSVLSSTRATPLVVKWTPARDVQSSIARYEVTATTNGQPSRSWVLPGTASGVTGVQALGATVSYGLVATDAAGNRSGVATSRTTRTHILEDTSGQATRSSRTWTALRYRYATNGTVTYATKAGAWMKFPISAGARQVAVVGPKGPGRGQFKVYIDGAYVKTIDARASGGKSKQILWWRSIDPARAHTITVKVVGTKGRPRVDVDAILTLR
jgi:subtilisin family serine protease